MSIGIVGLGYVGLPLAVAFAEAGHDVVGLDVDPRKVAAHPRGDSYIEDIPSERLRARRRAASAPTTRYADLAGTRGDRHRRAHAAHRATASRTSGR